MARGGRADTGSDKKEGKEEEVSKKQAAAQQAQVHGGLQIKKVTTQYVWSMLCTILDVERCAAYAVQWRREKKKLRLVNRDWGAGGKNVSDPG